MPEIENYSVYNDRMRRSMWDKAFFMDKVPGTELIVDYGCADGSLIRFLHSLFPSMHFIGFDIDPEMIAAASRENTPNTWYFSDPDEMLEKIASLGIERRRIAVNFSSVLHEIFHYDCDRDMITRLIDAINPRYLVVRDMMYHSENESACIPQAAQDQIRSVLPAWQIEQFEARWGSIALRRNLAHLILKYKYTENWERECAENYFSYTLEDLSGLLDPRGEFSPLLLSRYILPWCRYDAENNLGIDMGNEFTTHFSIILSRQYKQRPTLNA
ncbi:MAG: class I SAM-dependent methyltransferase [Clostridia bacterium]|nr:class I SAM-dependent methyltransferase [Clostridia bacterium]